MRNLKCRELVIHWTTSSLNSNADSKVPARLNNKFKSTIQSSCLTLSSMNTTLLNTEGNWCLRPLNIFEILAINMKEDKRAEIPVHNSSISRYDASTMRVREKVEGYVWSFLVQQWKWVYSHAPLDKIDQSVYKLLEHAWLYVSLPSLIPSHHYLASTLASCMPKHVREDTHLAPLLLLVSCCYSSE